jgi:hypothetical protein
MSTSISLNGAPGISGPELASYLDRTTADKSWLARANSFISPIGLSPGLGSIVMRRSSLDQIDLTDALRLSIGADDGPDRVFPDLRCAGNPIAINAGAYDPAYVVNLTDSRIDLTGTTNQRFQWRYSPQDAFPISETEDKKTWASVAQYLWEQLAIGDWPGMPAEVPLPDAEVIDQLDLHGFRLVDALEDCLGAIGCGVAWDITGENDPSIVYFPTATDRAIDAMRSSAGRLIWDESPYSPDTVGPIPAVVVVLFPVWYQNRSTDDPRKVFAAPVARPPLKWGPGAVLTDKVVYLQDYTPCRLNLNGSVANSGVLSQRADQVARIWFDRLTNAAPLWPIRRSYGGINGDPNLMAGASFDVVGWQLGAAGPVTFAARSGNAGIAGLYEPQPKSGVVVDVELVPYKRNGVLQRAGGIAPHPERERDAIGFGATETAGGVRIIGAGLGPYYQRGSSLRQGDWVVVGSGGRTDRRGRLWRNWYNDSGSGACQTVPIITQVCPVVDAEGRLVSLEHKYRNANICSIEWVGDEYCASPQPPCCPPNYSSSSSSGSLL